MNPAVSEYGADASGLICGFVMGASAGAVAREIDSEQAALWLAARREAIGDAEAAGFVWLHFNLAHTGALR